MLMANIDAQCIGGEGPAVTLGSPVLEVAAIGMEVMGEQGELLIKKEAQANGEILHEKGAVRCC